MIPGITTKNRLPRLGKIRLGEKKISQRTQKEYPSALDHFSFVDVPEVEAVYGKECKEIYPVLLPHDDEEIWFPTARKAYRKSGLFCACDDGETARRVYVPKTKDEPGDEQGQAYIKATGLEVEPGEMFEMPCPGEECPYFENKFCKNIGRLLFMLPSVPTFGVYEITTSSYNGIVNVLSMARAIKAQAGRLAGIPFALKLAPQQVQADGKSKTVHILSLEFRGSIFDLQKANRQLAGGRVVALLPEPGESIPDDLMPRAGASLEERLTGAKPEPLVSAPRRASEAKPAPVTTLKATPADEALGLDPIPDDEPGPSEADALPVYVGPVVQVTSRNGKTGGKDWTYWDIEGKGGKKYRTFDEAIGEFAGAAVKAKSEVEIVFETHDTGLRVVEIRQAGEAA